MQPDFTSGVTTIDHPRATAALVLGLVSVIGSVLVAPAALGPVAWYLGISARRDIAREPQRWAGHRQATAGMVLGIMATFLLMMLALVAVVVAGLVALALQRDTGYGG